MRFQQPAMVTCQYCSLVMNWQGHAPTGNNKEKGVQETTRSTARLSPGCPTGTQSLTLDPHSVFGPQTMLAVDIYGFMLWKSMTALGSKWTPGCE